MNQVRDAYSERSDEYTAALRSIEHTHPSDRELVSRWAQETSGSIVDAGCGPGHWTHFLHERGLDVQGIDLVPRFIKKARQRFPKASFHEGMLEALPFANNSLGGILAWYSLIHTPPSNLSRTLAELARVLKPGGSILVGFFDGPNIARTRPSSLTSRTNYPYRVARFSSSPPPIPATRLKPPRTEPANARRDRADVPPRVL